MDFENLRIGSRLFCVQSLGRHSVPVYKVLRKGVVHSLNGISMRYVDMFKMGILGAGGECLPRGHEQTKRIKEETFWMYRHLCNHDSTSRRAMWGTTHVGDTVRHISTSMTAKSACWRVMEMWESGGKKLWRARKTGTMREDYSVEPWKGELTEEVQDSTALTWYIIIN